MRRGRVLLASMATLVAVFCSMPPVVHAGGALIYNGFGEPLAYDTAQPVVYSIDQGSLGQLGNDAAAALVDASFDIWEAVPGAALNYQRGEPLPCDVTPATALDCGPDHRQILANGFDGISPVIFDTDGDLIDAFLGFGAANQIVAFAIVSGGTFLPPVISESESVINGRFFDGVTSQFNPELESQDAFQAVAVHEFGHWVNLDHSQINLQVWLDGNGDNDRFLPTMFPTASDDNTQFLSLHADDIATFAGLYPAGKKERLRGVLDNLPPPGRERGQAVSASVRGTASLSGRLLMPDGVTPFQGANMVLRSVDAPQQDSFATVSGTAYRPVPPGGVLPAEYGGPPDPALEGQFDFSGLPPGSYTLEVEEIDTLFVLGSAVGPFNFPPSVPGPNEYWSGEAESASDDPAGSALLTLTAGDELTGVDIIINDNPAPALLYAVDDAPFNPGVPFGLGTIIELDLDSGTILKRLPTPERNSALAEGLAFAHSRDTLFFTDGFGSGTIYEMSVADGTVLNSFAWPASAGGIDGLAFLNGPSQPPGGILYALDHVNDVLLALDPDTGDVIPGRSLLAQIDLFAGLGGAGDDLFVSTFGSFIIHVRPADAAPQVNVFEKPEREQFLAGMGFDGDSLYASSLVPPLFRVWRIDPTPATDIVVPSFRLDVLEAFPDPTPIVFGGFSAIDVALRGDLDGSGSVDGFDLAAFSRAFASGAGDDAFLPGADLDRDSFVGASDLAIMASFVGRGLWEVP